MEEQWFEFRLEALPTATQDRSEMEPMLKRKKERFVPEK